MAMKPESPAQHEAPQPEDELEAAFYEASKGMSRIAAIGPVIPSQAEKAASSRRDPGYWVYGQPFYELMHAYRHAPITDQKAVVSAFGDVQNFIRQQVGLEKQQPLSTSSQTPPTPDWRLTKCPCCQQSYRVNVAALEKAELMAGEEMDQCQS